MDAKTYRRWVDKVDKTGPGGCWIWVASVDADGYGWFRDGKVKRAHRVAYEHYVGAIDPGMDIDHICRVRSCVNPEHLRLMRRADNVLAGIGASATNARKKRCVHGHEFTPENTYVTPRGWRHCRACRRRHH